MNRFAGGFFLFIFLLNRFRISAAPQLRRKRRRFMKKKLLSVILAAAVTFSLAACGSASSSAGTASGSASAASSAASTAASAASSASAGGSGVEDGVFTIANECGYAPYNWAQPTDTNNSVQIADSDQYANGYDIMIAKKICDAYGWKLEVKQLDFDSLVPAVQSGTIDAAIAGQSMTAERAQNVDFAGPYFYASIVCLTKSDSKYASAKGISDLAGGTCTSQISTIWYDNCLPQIKDAKIQTAAESAPAMLMAVETGQVDYVCCDMPTAEGALVAYPDLKILDFSSGSDNFKVSDEEINIGISVRKGNTELKDKIDAVLSKMTKDDFNSLMTEATKIAPTS